jgi:sulfhydrogenase subunit beta (sulfur reductase)
MTAMLSKDNLVPWLKRLGERMEIVAPILVEGTPVFATWKGEPLALEENPLCSPVEFLFPQKEVLFSYVQYSGRYTFAAPPWRARLIFGIRPCDLKAISILDMLLGAEPHDEAYLARRRSTVLVAYNCSRPGQDCSCLQMDAGPAAREGFDLQLTEIGSGYLVESGSPTGTKILEEHAEFFTQAQEEHLQEKERLLEEATMLLEAKKDRSPSAIEKAIEKADWDALGKSCLSCGSCTLVCPVCHCFNILDQGVPDGQRIRCRDCCLLSGFSRMASGANPRPSPGDRLKNWYLDKFEYIPANTGRWGCVGCGRCSRVCMGEMDRWRLEVKR